MFIGIGLPITSRFGVSSAISSGALSLLAGDDGLALDFTDDTWFTSEGFYGSAAVVGGGTQDGYDTSPDTAAASLLTYTSPSLKMTMGPSGVLRFGAHNLYLNSASPANQSITVVSGATYAVTITGSVSVTASGAATGTWTAGTQTFTAATTTLTLGSTSGAGTVHVRRTPSDSTYMATAGSIRCALPYQWTTAGVLEGILVEEARTNVALYSQQLDNAQWVKNQATVTANAATAPDGTTTFDLVTEDGSTNNHGVFSGNLGLSTSGTSYTASVYAARNGRDIQITFSSTGFGASQYANFNLATGALGTVTGGTAQIQDIGGGVYRCAFTATATATDAGGRGFSVFLINSTTATRAPSYAGNSTSGAYVWGAQDEVGSFPTSYIPTIASTVTRAADNISLGTGAFPWVNAEHTYYAMFSGLRGDSYVIGADLSGGSPYETARFNSGTNLQAFNSSVDLFMNGGAITAGAEGKVAVAFKANDAASYVNGSQAAIDTSGAMVTGINTFQVGKGANLGFANGIIKQLAYFPTRKTNAELQTLTT